MTDNVTLVQLLIVIIASFENATVHDYKMLLESSSVHILGCRDGASTLRNRNVLTYLKGTPLAQLVECRTLDREFESHQGPSVVSQEQDTSSSLLNTGST